jgi:hypothetical protein
MEISFLRPIDQPRGTRRLLDEVRTCFTSDCAELRMAVAFAKVGPFLRLERVIKNWLEQGKKISAIFGIDYKGTTKQALEFALANFNEIFVLHASRYVTFHPKFYLFHGSRSATCFYGSHNATVGGTETNFEGGVKISFELPKDQIPFDEAMSCWTSLLPDHCNNTKPLTEGLLDELSRAGLIRDENKKQPARSTTAAGPQQILSSLFPPFIPKPPSPLPESAFAKAKSGKKSDARPTTGQVSVVPSTPLAAEALVIEIKSLPNGKEVLLSKKALDQNPVFFGFPFTGMTVPKKRKNPPYTQRDPRPVVNVVVYDAGGKAVITEPGFRLKMDFYERKAEFRISFSSDVLAQTSAYSVMVMKRSEEDDRDYDVDIFNPGSGLYDNYRSVCNQPIPKGGAARPRKMGWI